ncbi:hypothetical protein KIN20_007769 [Parelaphostrongylus tenuis]|uniref:Uncharacterized protein n=1 Tax=Parelaphostrongylus tenuis TaxID=148309 RepID=A0AAD5MVX2_PARTN|nr:hypothetical protein KIN20_007769 [Parelaphostrongylus tenuis]
MSLPQTGLKTALDRWQSLRGPNAQEPSLAEAQIHRTPIKVSTRGLEAVQLWLMFDNVSDAPLADPELPKSSCASNAPDVVKSDNKSSKCLP